MIKKHTIAIVAIFLLASACGSDPSELKNESISEQKSQVSSIGEPPQIVGCWRLSKIGFNMKDVDNESKWQDKNGGTILLLRDDGKYMKWFGDYMDVGTFEAHNNSLYLNLKGGDGIDTFKLDTLTSSEMIIINESSSIPIEKYRKQSKKSYNFWKAKFK